jgi:hypothetical protein
VYVHIQDLMHRWPEFIALQAFSMAWKAFGLSDDKLRELQTALMRLPKAGAVIAGTGGIRKLRLAVHTGQGKRGSARLVYAYFEKSSVIGLLFLYAKNDRADMSAQEKAALRMAVENLEKYLLYRESGRKGMR